MRENKTHTQTRLSVGLMIPGFPALIVRQTKLTACELLQLIIPIPARIYALRVEPRYPKEELDAFIHSVHPRFS